MCDVCNLQVKAAEQWQCYMCCSESQSVGLLTARQDWDRKLQDLFKMDNEEYVSHSIIVYVRILYICRSDLENVCIHL